MSAGRILVLGDDTRSFLTTVRSLGRAGWEVHAAWATPGQPALASRYLREVHPLPLFSAFDGEWRSQFDELLARERFDLVVPVAEPAITVLQAERDHVAAGTRLLLLPSDVYAVAASKVASWELANRLGIPVPPSSVIDEPIQVDAAVAARGLPLFAKPDVSSALPFPYSRRTVSFHRSAEGLRVAAARQFALGGRLILQAPVPGQGVGVEVLAEDGRLLAVHQHIRLHEECGHGSYRETQTPDAALVGAVEQLLRALRYTGLCMCEFRKAPDGWWFLEMNPRFWGSIPLAVAAGIDFPRYAVEQALGRPRPSYPTARVGTRARNERQDLRWLAVRLTEGCRGWGERLKVLRDVMAETRDARRRGVAHGDLNVPDDRAPWWADMRLYARVLRARLGMAAIQLAAHVPAVRCRLAARWAVRLARAGQVTLVCNGNIQRSPFAAAWLRARWLGSGCVDSAGMLPQDGRPVPAESLVGAGARGVDLQPHRARQLRRPLDGYAVIFEWAQCRELAARDLVPRACVVPLGLFRPAGSLWIADPVDDPTTVGPIYDQIVEAGRQLLAFAFGPPVARRRNRVRESTCPGNPSANKMDAA